jgi:hypothetical protein
MVLSPNYFKSNYTPSEWAAAFWQDPRGSDSRLVPVLVLDCTLEGLIPDISYIDLRNKNESSAKKLLIDGVKTDRAKPKSSPGYPGPKSLSDSNERKSLYQSQWGDSAIQRADQDAQTISPDQVHRERLNHNA